MGKQQVWFQTACVFLFLSLASQINSTSQKENDLIQKLPGQPSDVSFKQYGGYVAIDEPVSRQLYYYFVEAINANASTPLVLWFNGGPGCSSLQGAFLEHGPFRVHSDGKSLYPNPYAWNNVANVLYLESPAIVGFSYTNDLDKYQLGDKQTAEDNYAFLVKWLERFPEYKGREFYLTGQSYAGHYVPQLAQLIVQRKNQTSINLRGVSIGNPGLDRTLEYGGEKDFWIGHAVYFDDSVDREDQSCGQAFSSEESRKECSDAIQNKIDLTNHLDNYNIYAPRCLNSTLTSEPKKDTTVLGNDPCTEVYLTAYLNNANVQEAMHANTTKQPGPWAACAEERGAYSQEDQTISMLPILSELMGAGVRVLVYSGDTDAAVPFTSTKLVLKKFNQTIEKKWRPWISEGEVGGYVQVYKNNFSYATVRGAGHDVPRDQPIRAFTLFTSFLRNTDLPKLPSRTSDFV